MKLKYLLQINLIGYAMLLSLAGCQATAATPALPTETPTLIIPTKLLVTMTPSPKTPSPTATSTAITDDFIKIQYDEKNWTYHALDKHLPEEIKKQKQTNVVHSIAFSPDGVAWVGTSAGVWTYLNGVWKVFLADDGLANNAAYSVAISPSGDVWVASNGGISHFYGNKWQISLVADIREIAISPDETVWARPRAYGLYYFDGKTWEVVDIGGEKDVPADSIAIAPNGNLWVGVEMGGLFRLDGNKWTHYSYDVVPQDFAPFSGGDCGLCMPALYIEPNGTFWAMMSKAGLVKFDGDYWTRYPYYTKGIPSTIEISKTRVWIGEVGSQGRISDNVIVFIENGRKHTFSDLPFNRAHHIKIAPDGAVWVGTEKGLYIYRE